MVPRENKNNAYANLGGGGGNKKHYGIFRNGQLYIILFVSLTVENQKSTICIAKSVKLY